MAKNVDATQGNLIKHIFVYTIPLIISIVVQTLFVIADRAVLGNMAGSAAVAAIGATSGAVTSLITNGAMGLATGTTIILARFAGQKNQEKIRQTIDTSLLTAVGLGAVIAIFGYFFTPVILTLTKCPSECYNDAMMYMRIYLFSTPAILVYNYGSAILRVLGDTKRPLIYILTAGVVNVVLNIVLCLILSQKVLAVAIATLVSHLLSVAMLLWRLCHFDGGYSLRLRSMRFKCDIFTKILRFGIPSSISKLVLPLGNLQIVTAINTFGVDAVAGTAAASSVNSMVLAVDSGFSSAATTFMGQNIGAGKVERVKKSFWYLLCINVLITGTLGALAFLSGRFWIGLIVGSSSKNAIDFGMQRMFYVTLLIFISAANSILTSALQAFGYPLLISVTNIFFNLGFRVMWMQFIYPQRADFATIMLCFPVSWLLNMLFYAIFFTVVYIRYTKKGICKKI
ncbi:MAG: MATE family efflux transporter [Ruminococcaceae bacterium]|nr:MATE family efflux transporter [Oscillospiraceae bacterium]